MNLEATLEVAVSELAPPLLRYCRSRAEDVGLAEDAAQEALAALVGRWRRSGPPESPEAYVFTIARRRLGRRMMQQRVFAPLEAVLGRQARESGPAERLELSEEVRDAARAVSKLRPKLREALLLVSAGELDTKAAAQVLGISPSALKMRVARARARVLELLQENEHG